MTAPTRIERAKALSPSLPKFSSGNHGRWIGFDFSGVTDPSRAKWLVPLLLVAVVTALGVAALRIDLIRIRYAMAASVESENSLIEERRALIAHKRQLRDPTVLAVEARERGFRSPAHIFSIVDPKSRVSRPPAVAAGRAESQTP